MIQVPHIYAVIIGSEILDCRRVDKHFDYLSRALQEKGHTLFASLTIKDDKALIENTFKMVKEDPEAILFSFGGIGSTPDDLTRQLSANIFSDSRLYRHPQFKQDIETRLGERAYPHPIKMADLPKDAQLLFNPINNMSGFYLEERFFFMPGFPEMAQPMVDAIINTHLPQPSQPYTKAFLAQCGEGKIQDLMYHVPTEVELSSLPMIRESGPYVEFSLSSQNKALLEKTFLRFTSFLDQEKIGYTLL